MKVYQNSNLFIEYDFVFNLHGISHATKIWEDTTTASFYRFLEHLPIDCKILITFDDGLFSIKSHVWHLSSNYNIDVAIFVVNEFIGKADYLAACDLVELSKVGVQICSHSYSHSDLSSLSFLEIREDLSKSKTELGQLLGCNVSWLSIPFGSFNSDVVAAAKDVGYFGIFTSQPFKFGFNAKIVNRISLNERLIGFVLSLYPFLGFKSSVFILSLTIVAKDLFRVILPTYVYVQIRDRINNLRK